MGKSLTWEKRLSQFHKIHGSKYTYIQPTKTTSLTKIQILCLTHGSFQQTIKKHIIGQGCPKCGLERRSATRSLGLSKFIQRGIIVHGGFYSYENTIYKNSWTKLIVTCPTHGDFETLPPTHLNGHRCPKCALDGAQLSHEEVIKKFKEAHGDRYDYSKVTYKGHRQLVEIICSTHGAFFQAAEIHWNGCNCPYCAGTKLHWSDFKKQSHQVHQNKYTYPDQSFNGVADRIQIICPEHGVFNQVASEHQYKYGCPKCGKTQLLTHDEVLQKFYQAHGDIYDYTKVVYKNQTVTVEIQCKKHGSFLQRPCHHWSGSGCPACANHRSLKELELRDFVTTLAPDVSFSVRNLIKPYELDIVIPGKNIAIEFNGLYWHSSAQKSKDYHRQKTALCKEQGYRLIHVWEDDWDLRQDVVKNFLRHNIVGPDKKIFARKTEVREIDKLTAKEFLQRNHIQGASMASVAIGLFYNDALVTVTTFVKNGYWDLRRHCNKSGTAVLGSLGKATAYFVKNFQPDDLYSFCDLSQHDGRSYFAAGFIEDSVLKPDYQYIVGQERRHKFNFRRKRLGVFLGNDFNSELTEVENMRNNGYYQIFDCGKIKFKYNKRED